MIGGQESGGSVLSRSRIPPIPNPQSPIPSASQFTPRERRLIAALRSPAAVQAYLNALPYNQEPGGRATLRTFRGVVRTGCAHCLEAALFAAVVLEQHGYPARVLSVESIDELDHVIFLYRPPSVQPRVARPVFATPRALALSYFDPYVDFTGRLTGYAVVDLARVMGTYDWRLSDGNVWKVERVLLDYPHRKIRSSDARVDALRRRYRAYRAAHGRKPLFYRRRDRWMPLPEEFRDQG